MKAKRFVCVLVLLLLLLPALFMSVNAEPPTELARVGNWGIGGFPSNGKYQIVKYYGNETNVTIPTQLGQYAINGVLEYAFSDNTTVKKLTIPDGMYLQPLVESPVETVILGKGVTLYDGTFANCTALKSVTLPSDLDTIPYQAFYNCTSLKSLTMPDSIHTIGAEAFANSGLSSIQLPGNLIRIQDAAFANCNNLTAIKIPKSVSEIKTQAFTDCSNLSKIEVESGNSGYYTDSQGNLCHRNSHTGEITLLRIPAKEYTDGFLVSENVQIIEGGALSGIPGLTAVEIPKNVQQVEAYALENCPNVTEILFESEPRYLSQHAFANSVVIVYYPGDTGEWSMLDPSAFWSATVVWVPYCTGIHTGPIGQVIEPATCTKTGRSKNTCDLCGQEYDYVIPVQEHTYDDGVITQQAICMTNGIRTFSCTGCDHTYEEMIPAPGHRFDPDKEVILKAATCTEYGSVEEHCKDCDYTHLGQLPLISHNYSSLQCTVCGDSCTRLYGANRYETSLIIADYLKESVGRDQFSNIIVASGTNFADALSGGYLANQKYAPILLTNDKNQANVIAYIKENLSPDGTVYLLGGTAAVPASYEKQLAGFHVKRLGGTNRYETNYLILKEAGVLFSDLVICTGKAFPDSLSASTSGRPIMLVGDTLTAQQKELLKDNSACRYIIGGTNAVSQAIEKAAAANGTTIRIGGTTRYETSALIAKQFSPKYVSDLVLAYGENFPDGLSGAPLLGRRGVMVLTTPGKEDLLDDFFRDNSVDNCIVLGGPTLVTDKCADKIFNKIVPNG